MKKESKFQYVLIELMYHLPFSIFGVTMGLVTMGVLSFLATLMGSEGLLPQASMELFHVFHPAHILVSAVTTTAMFYKHEKRVVKAMVVGFLGSIAICGISDIFFPYVGGIILKSKMHMHVCFFEHPGLIIPFAVVGVLAGFPVAKSFENPTQYSHSAHVFLSSAASILYLIAFGLRDWAHAVGGVFLVTIIAVMVPCCLSDIVFPLACVHRDCQHSDELKHRH